MEKKVLFVDVIGRDDNRGGGSSASLRLLLEELSQTHMDVDMYYLVNGNNNAYYQRNISGKFIAFPISFPKVLNKFGRAILKPLNLIQTILFALPKVNIEMYRKVKKYNIDTIVYNEGRAFTTFLPVNIIFSLQTKVRTVKYIRGNYGINSIKSKITNYFATKIIVLAEYLKEDFNAEVRRKTHVLANGMKFLKSTPLSTPKEYKEYLNFVNVGTITRYKGQKDVIEAFCKLYREHKIFDFKLVFVGEIHDKNYMEEIRELIVNDKLENKIHFVGFQENVQNFLSNADVLIHASYNEGVPRVLLEAAYNELFTIASDIKGNKEVVKDGHGLIFKVSNIDDLSEKVSQYLEMSKQEISKAIEQNFLYVYENYNLSLIAKKFLEILYENN